VNQSCCLTRLLRTPGRIFSLNLSEAPRDTWCGGRDLGAKPLRRLGVQVSLEDKWGDSAVFICFDCLLVLVQEWQAVPEAGQRE